MFCVTATLCASQPKTQPRPARAVAERLNTLGAGYMGMQNFARALELFRQAQAADKSFSAARLNQGIALLNQQKYPAALDVLREVTEREPDNARAWYNLGLLYKATAEPQQALRSFQEAARIDPEDPDTRYFIGQLQLDAKQFPEAIASLGSALALDHFHASAEFALARAYQRSGDTANARIHSERFQKLTRENIAAPLAVGYGQQGRLSLVEAELPQNSAARAPIPIKFRDVTRFAGLGARLMHKADSTVTACWFDYDNDGWPDLFVGGVDGGTALFHNARGKLTDVSRLAHIPNGPASACAAGDYNNDGRSDLALIIGGKLVLLENEAGGTFKDVTGSAKLDVISAENVSFVDYDHDGDLDLAAGSLWQNNGNGTFQPATFKATFRSVLTVDVNNDNAVDLITSSDKTTVLLNEREGNFAPGELEVIARGITAADFDRDGWIDLAGILGGSVSLFRNEHGTLRAQPTGSECSHVSSAAWVDFDNDGFPDLVVARENGSICLLRNQGLGRFTEYNHSGSAQLKAGSHARLIPIDFDNDGDPDLLVIGDGVLRLFRNEGGNRNNWVKVALKGVADNRSGYGAKVETFAVGGYSKIEYNGNAAEATQNNIPLLFGLGNASQAERIRLRWPTGVVQDEVERVARKIHAIPEIDRRSSSCPLLFTWNGSRFEFISDVIGAGVIGHWVAPGERNIPDPTEYVKIEGKQLQVENGRLRLRFMEPMEEVNYFDQAKLLAIDHPAGTEVFPNERFVSGPPFPDGRAITTRSARLPLRAWDDRGNNVLPQIANKDRVYVNGFELEKFSGFAKTHRLTLELPTFDARSDLRLLLYGYTEYFTANSMYAAHQSGLDPVAPYVEAELPDGSWKRIVDDMGFPAGLPRMIVAELTGKVPAGTKRMRIVTNLQIYWDQILVDTTEQIQQTRVSEASIAKADLRFIGYPRPVAGQSPGDLRYDYQMVSRTGPFATPRGAYTRFGDVSPLVSAADDKFVIFGPGEEIALEFDAESLPALPDGWRRDYFFYADGFVKDMDFAGAESFAVAPLPFHGMTGYPYPVAQKYPQSSQHLEYELEYNDRFIFAPALGSYGFSYSHHPEE
jgi:tetratricopeptide (TPR) repeat protein